MGKPGFCLNRERTDSHFEDEARLLAYHDLIAGIVAAMEARDGDTASYSMRVAELTQRRSLSKKSI